jgi:hypothetical protein
MRCRMARLLEMKLAMHSALLVPFLLLHLAIEVSLREPCSHVCGDCSGYDI